MNIRAALISLAVMVVFITLSILFGWWEKNGMVRILISAGLGVVVYSFFETGKKRK